MGFSRKINYISFSIILSFFTLCSSDILAQERIVLSTGMNTAIETVAETCNQRGLSETWNRCTSEKIPCEKSINDVQQRRKRWGAVQNKQY